MSILLEADPADWFEQHVEAVSYDDGADEFPITRRSTVPDETDASS